MSLKSDIKELNTRLDNLEAKLNHLTVKQKLSANPIITKKSKYAKLHERFEKLEIGKTLTKTVTDEKHSWCIQTAIRQKFGCCFKATMVGNKLIIIKIK